MCGQHQDVVTEIKRIFIAIKVFILDWIPSEFLVELAKKAN